MAKDVSRLPKRLNPDPVRDAIVEIRFKHHLPFEIYLGQMYGILRNLGFEYQHAGPEVVPADLVVLKSGKFLHQGSEIALTVRPGSLGFNVVGAYPGWEIYFGLVKNTLMKVHQVGVFTSFERVGVRFISEMEGTNILSNLKMGFPQFPLDEHMQENSKLYRIELLEPPLRIMLNLTEGRQGSKEKVHSSIADVDVIRPDMHTNDVNEILRAIEQNHQREKEIFFHLLKEDFLASLNPEYES